MKKLLIAISAVIFSASVMGQSVPVEVQTEYMNKAFEAYDANNLDSAVVYFTDEVNQHPDNGYAWLFIGICYRFMNVDYDSTVSVFEHALSLIPKSDKIFMAFALSCYSDMYLVKDDYDRALSILLKAHKLNKADVNVLNNLGVAYIGMKKYNKAELYINRLIELYPDNIKGYYLLAQLKMYVGRYDEAMKLCDSLIEQDVNYELFHFLKSLIAEKQEDYELAIDELFMTYILGYDSDVLGKIIHYLNYEGTEMYTLAKLRVYSIKYPDIGNFSYVLADYYREKYQYKKAISFYSSLQNDFPDAVNLFVDISLCKYEIGEYEEMLIDADSFLIHNDTTAMIWYSRSQANYALGRIEEAIGDVDKAISLNPEYAFWYYLKGWYEEHLAELDYSEILDNYNMSMQLDHDYAYTFMCAGRIYMNQGKTEEAKRCYDRVIELEKNLSPEDITCLNFVYFYVGDTVKAEETMKKMLEADERGNYYDAACLYALLGKTDKALMYLEKYFQTGHQRFTHIERDVDFDSIRELPEFKALIEKYKK